MTTTMEENLDINTTNPGVMGNYPQYMGSLNAPGSKDQDNSFLGIGYGAAGKRDNSELTSISNMGLPAANNS